jgi:hypothetical protein
LPVDGMPDVPENVLESIGDAVEGVATPEAAATNQTAPEETATPEGSTTEEAAPDAPDSFTKLDPNAIPEEMRPYYESMQRDYTRKTQEAAPWRKLGDELGLSSPEDVRQAAELWAYLQDQNNLRQFHDQLGQVIGVTAAPAPAAPVETPQTAADEFSNLDDPALASIRSEVQSLKQAVAERDLRAQQEALQWALLGEMNRQEALLKDQHPEWGESDGENASEEWQAIWNLAPAFNGDLVRAATVIESAQQAGITRLLNSKAQAAETPGLTVEAPSRAGVVVPESDFSDLELRAETARAKEYLRGVVNQSE